MKNSLLWTDKNNPYCLFSKNGFMVGGGLVGSEALKNNAPMVVQDEQTSQDYAQAINTMLALRKCGGSHPAGYDKIAYSIVFNLHLQRIEINETSNWAYGVNLISPYFSTEAHCIEAIKTVGEQNIIHMFKAFHKIV